MRLHVTVLLTWYAMVATWGVGFAAEHASIATNALLERSSSVSDNETRVSYQRPPEVIERLLNGEPLPSVSLSPDGRWLLLMHTSAAPGIAEVASSRLRFLGMDVDPRTGGSPVDNGTMGTGVTLVRVADGRRWELDVPQSGLDYLLWAPNSDKFLFTHSGERSVELWVGSVSVPGAHRIEHVRLMDVQGAPCAWMPGSAQVLCQEIAEDPAVAEPVESRAAGPVVRDNGQRPVPRIPSLDESWNSWDDTLYEHYRSSQPVLLDITTGARRKVGAVGIYNFLTPSPDGKYLLSIRTVRPYSHLFADEWHSPKQIDILDVTGRLVHALGLQIDGWWGGFPKTPVSTKIRHIMWFPGAAATLVFVEALDGGNPSQPTQWRDRLMRLDAPFAESPTELIRTAGRLATFPGFILGESPNLAWLADGTAWLEEADVTQPRKRVWQVHIRDGGPKPKLLFDFGELAGHPLLSAGNGRVAIGYDTPFLKQHGQWVYLSSVEQCSQGQCSTLHAVNLKSRRRLNVFEPRESRYEEVVAVLNHERLLVRSESADEAPNFFLSDGPRGQVLPVTDIAIPVPELRGIRVQLRRFSRSDGVALSGELYLPTNYEPGHRVPVIIYAYPHTYPTKEIASRVRTSPNMYRWNSKYPVQLAISALVTQGYAVFQDVSMPVVGGMDANDSAVSQLVENAEAAVGDLVAAGIADKNRIGVVGHSYGGTMVATLLAHSKLFAAGVGIDGAYNFTNSPIGFSNEARTLWAAPGAYLQLSAVMSADKISSPFLIVHGEQDAMVTTPLVESEHMYAALNALGRKARFVVLPFEGHVPRARESIDQLAWEVLEWFDKHVKHDQFELQARGPGR